jgi:hypothetical protein
MFPAKGQGSNELPANNQRQTAKTREKLKIQLAAFNFSSITAYCGIFQPGRLFRPQAPAAAG